MDPSAYDDRIEDRPPTPRQKLVAQAIVAVFVIAMVVGGWWVVDAMFIARKADDCLAQGNKRCFQIDTTRLK